jgi:hypothetical protein
MGAVLPRNDDAKLNVPGEQSTINVEKLVQ